MNLPDLMDRWDAVPFSCYNLIQTIKFGFRSFRIRKLLKKNRSLAKKFAGQRCFIVLNGPSLNSWDITKLVGEKVFCVNYMYRSPVVKVLHPTFYCVSDGAFFQPKTKIPSSAPVDELIAACPDCSFLFTHKFLKYHDKVAPNVFVSYSKDLPHLSHAKTNMSKLSSNYVTVGLYALQWAIYMGFTEIYLLGYDFPPTFFTHFSKLGTEKEIQELAERRDESYVCGRYWSYTRAQRENYIINKKALKKGIHIFNVNPESYVKAFPFVSFDSLFS